MRIHQILCGLAAASLLTLPASAQEVPPAPAPVPAPDGRYAEALTRIIADARTGTCSELMSASVQLACQRRIADIALTLERFGPVEKMTLLNTQERGEGMVETYEIRFERDQVMTWHIGGLRDGQFSTAFSPDG